MNIKKKMLACYKERVGRVVIRNEWIEVTAPGARSSRAAEPRGESTNGTGSSWQKWVNRRSLETGNKKHRRIQNQISSTVCYVRPSGEKNISLITLGVMIQWRSSSSNCLIQNRQGNSKQSTLADSGEQRNGDSAQSGGDNTTAKNLKPRCVIMDAQGEQDAGTDHIAHITVCTNV